MTRLIDKEKYFAKLKELLEKYYPNKDYRTMSQFALNLKIKEQMTSYVVEKYGSYHSDKLRTLLDENHILFEECLTELGIMR